MKKDYKNPPLCLFEDGYSIHKHVYIQQNKLISFKETCEGYRSVLNALTIDLRDRLFNINLTESQFSIKVVPKKKPDWSRALIDPARDLYPKCSSNLARFSFFMQGFCYAR